MPGDPRSAWRRWDRLGPIAVLAAVAAACAITPPTSPSTPGAGQGASSVGPAGCSPLSGSVASPVAPTETAGANYPPGAKVVNEIEIQPLEVTWLAADSTAVWVHGEGEILRIDPGSDAIVGHVPTPHIEYGYLASGEGAVWQADFDRDVVLRVDPQTNTVVDTITVGDAPEGVGTSPGAVWVANHHAGTVSHIDPVTNTVVATIDIGPSGANGPLELAAGDTGVWVHVPNLGRVMHIDPATGCVVGAVQVDGAPALDGASVWIPDPVLGAVVRVDPQTNEILAVVGLGLEESAFGGLAAGLGSVWLSTEGGLFRIDASTDRVVGLLPARRGDVAVGEDAVWLVPYGEGTVVKIVPE